MTKATRNSFPCRRLWVLTLVVDMVVVVVKDKAKEKGGDSSGFPGNRACGPGLKSTHAYTQRARPVAPRRFWPGLRHRGRMNKRVAQHGNGTEGPQQYWADGGCLNHDASGRRRKAYGSWSDGVNVRRFDFPDANTSNEAEYRTLIELLSTFEAGAAPTVYTDSKLMRGQLARGWRVRAENLKPLYRQARELLRLTRARLTWVPRKQIVARLGH